MLKITREEIKREENRQKRYDLEEKIQHIAFMINRKDREYSPGVSDYSERHGISRERLYSLEKEFIEEFSCKVSGRKRGKKKRKPKRLSCLCEEEQKQILRVVLTAAVMPASGSEIKKLIIEAFDIAISKSAIKGIIRKYAVKAKEVLQELGVREKVRYLTVDEIFSGKKPILVGVELNSFAVVISEKSDKRDHKAWKKALEGFPLLELVTSDKAKGIIKAISDMNKMHQFDLFHFKRDACKILRSLESQAYKKIESEYKAFDKLKKCKDDSKLENLTKIYHDCCNKANKSIEVFDQCQKAIDLIFEALEVFDSQGNLLDPAQSLKKFERGACLLARASPNRNIKNLAKRSQEENLILFKKQLHRKLLNIPFRWDHAGSIPRKKVIEILAQHWFLSNQLQRSFSRKQDETYQQWVSRKQKSLEKAERKHLSVLFQLRRAQIAVKNFEEVQKQVFQAFSEVFRASSLVESYNSQVRICQQVKKSIHHDFLYLSALKWNCTAFQSGKRKGKSPFQILGIHKERVNWLDLLLAA